MQIQRCETSDDGTSHYSPPALVRRRCMCLLRPLASRRKPPRGIWRQLVNALQSSEANTCSSIKLRKHARLEAREPHSSLDGNLVTRLRRCSTRILAGVQVHKVPRIQDNFTRSERGAGVVGRDFGVNGLQPAHEHRWLVLRASIACECRKNCWACSGARPGGRRCCRPS
jgi:hypothetical protein